MYPSLTPALDKNSFYPVEGACEKQMKALKRGMNEYVEMDLHSNVNISNFILSIFLAYVIGYNVF